MDSKKNYLNNKNISTKVPFLSTVTLSLILCFSSCDFSPEMKKIFKEEAVRTEAKIAEAEKSQDSLQNLIETYKLKILEEYKKDKVLFKKANQVTKKNKKNIIGKRNLSNKTKRVKKNIEYTKGKITKTRKVIQKTVESLIKENNKNWLDNIKDCIIPTFILLIFIKILKKRID